MADLATARAAKARLRAGLAHEQHIVGVGLMRDADLDGYELCVAVSRADALVAIPAVVDGVPVRVRVTEPVHAQRHDLTARTSAAARPSQPRNGVPS